MSWKVLRFTLLEKTRSRKLWGGEKQLETNKFSSWLSRNSCGSDSRLAWGYVAVVLKIWAGEALIRIRDRVGVRVRVRLRVKGRVKVRGRMGFTDVQVESEGKEAHRCSGIRHSRRWGYSQQPP